MSVVKRITKEQQRKKEITMLCQYMDCHLQLLHIAVTENNNKEIEFQTEQLERIRTALFELEFFRK